MHLTAPRNSDAHHWARIFTGLISYNVAATYYVLQAKRVVVSNLDADIKSKVNCSHRKRFRNNLFLLRLAQDALASSAFLLVKIIY